MEEKYHRVPAPPVPELPATVSVYFFSIIANFMLRYWAFMLLLLNIY